MREKMFKGVRPWQPYRDLAAVSYYTAGQRLNDCVLLTWELVDFKHDTIQFCIQKTAKRLALPMIPELRRRLEVRHKLTTDKENLHVFPGLIALRSQYMR